MRMATVTAPRVAQPGAATVRPSTAPSTLMAGVMTPSPYSSAARRAPAPAGPSAPAGWHGAAPPAPGGQDAALPRLSARMTKVRYLMVTTKVIAQKTSDRTPSTFSGWGPPRGGRAALLRA